jgi:sugar-phosphatase
VTSADTTLALARLGAAGLPVPEVLVTVDDIDKGKPDPEVTCWPPTT